MIGGVLCYNYTLAKLWVILAAILDFLVFDGHFEFLKRQKCILYTQKCENRHSYHINCWYTVLYSHLVRKCHFGRHFEFSGIRQPFWILKIIGINFSRLKTYKSTPKLPKLATGYWKTNFDPQNGSTPRKKHFGHLFSKNGRRDGVPRKILV